MDAFLGGRKFVIVLDAPVLILPVRSSPCRYHPVLDASLILRFARREGAALIFFLFSVFYF